MIKLNDKYGIDIMALVTGEDFDYIDCGTYIPKLMKEDGAKKWNTVYVIIDLETGYCAENAEPYYPSFEDAYNDFEKIYKRKIKIKFSDVVNYYETFEITEEEFQKLKYSKPEEVLGKRLDREKISKGLKNDVEAGCYDIEWIKEMEDWK